MKLLVLLTSAVSAAFFAALLTPLVRRFAFNVGAIDRPGARKIHFQETPRLGGLAVVASAVIVLTGLYRLGVLDPDLISSRLIVGLAIGILPVLAISIIDDIHPLSAWPKFSAQFVGATIAVVGFDIRLAETIHLFRPIHIGWLAIPLSIAWIVGVTNAFNLIDGLDGLSAGLALISALSLAGISLIQASYGIATVAVVLAGALIGFLPFNFYPARMFLGDSGATSLGYTLACIALGGVSQRVTQRMSAGIAILVPVIVLGLPIADTVISLIRRIVGRLTSDDSRSIFAGDRRHIHHRLMDLGLEHKSAVILLYGIGVTLSIAAISSMFLSSRMTALLLLTMVTASFVGISRLEYDEFALLRSGLALKYSEAPVLRLSLMSVFFDLVLSVGALYASIVLKYEDWGIVATRPIASYLFALLPALTLTSFCAFRVYWRTWHNATVSDVARLVAAVATSAAGAGILCSLALPEPPPATFFVIYALVLSPVVGSIRRGSQLLEEWTRRATTASSEGSPVVIYCAGHRGSMALQALLSDHSHAMKPIGFIDDDAKKTGQYLKGYPVLGAHTALTGLIEERKISAVIVAGDLRAPQLGKVTDLCRRTGTPLLRFRVDFRVEEIPGAVSTPEITIVPMDIFSQLPEPTVSH